MANARDSARTYAKSDPIDALAVARAVLREPNLPAARLDGIEREIRLLVDRREDLVVERTRIICRLRWHLHELDPGWTPPAKLNRTSAFDKILAHISVFTGLVVADGPLGEQLHLGRSAVLGAENVPVRQADVVGLGPLHLPSAPAGG